MDGKLSPPRLSQIVAWIQNKHNTYLENQVYYDNLAKLVKERSSPPKNTNKDKLTKKDMEYLKGVDAEDNQIKIRKSWPVIKNDTNKDE